LEGGDFVVFKGTVPSGETEEKHGKAEYEYELTQSRFEPATFRPVESLLDFVCPIFIKKREYVHFVHMSSEQTRQRCDAIRLLFL
jgi:hypothetical protein